jgi:catechol 2,3-dioxygenase-like lactoylglutathione lyase family enzyme
VADLPRSAKFYRAVLESVGIAVARDNEHFLQADELFISGPYGPGSTVSHVHLAFQAADRATVEGFYKVALAAGGKDNGPPGERPYHPGYYAAYVLDPDGNNIEVVFHGPGTRSAKSIEVEPTL